jgi:hypothetical protein
LAEKAKGIAPERLKQNSSLDPEDLAKLIEQIDPVVAKNGAGLMREL